jgi:hypothetical protein
MSFSWITLAGNKSCRSGMFILDLYFFHPGSWIRIFSIPDPRSALFHPGSASKNLSILTPKKWFLSTCSSRLRILTFHPSRIPDPQHCWEPYLDARQRGLECGAGEQLGAREGAEVGRQLLVDPALHVTHRRLQVEVKVAILMGAIFRSARFIGSIGIVNLGYGSRSWLRASKV